MDAPHQGAQLGQRQRRVLPGLGNKRDGGLWIGSEKLLRRAQVDAERDKPRLRPVMQVPLHPAQFGSGAVHRRVAGLGQPGYPAGQCRVALHQAGVRADRARHQPHTVAQDQCADRHVQDHSGPATGQEQVRHGVLVDDAPAAPERMPGLVHERQHHPPGEQAGVDPQAEHPRRGDVRGHGRRQHRRGRGDHRGDTPGDGTRENTGRQQDHGNEQDPPARAPQRARERQRGHDPVHAAYRGPPHRSAQWACSHFVW